MGGTKMPKQIIDGIEKVVTVSDDLRDYQFSHIDDTDPSILYVSFVNAKGEYYFKKITDTSCVFYRGTIGNYTSDWTNRATRTYLIFNEVF